MSFTPTPFARITRTPSRMRARSFVTGFKTKSTLGEQILNASMLIEPILNDVNALKQDDATSSIPEPA